MIGQRRGGRIQSEPPRCRVVIYGGNGQSGLGVSARTEVAVVPAEARSSGALELDCSWRVDPGDFALVLDATLQVGDGDRRSSRHVLAHGRTVPAPNEFDFYDPLMRAWRDRIPAGSWNGSWAGFDPSRFSSVDAPEAMNPEAPRRWGELLYSVLANALAANVLTELRAMAGEHDRFRLVVRPMDPLSARLPFETLRWPGEPLPALFGRPPLSIVRLPVSLEEPNGYQSSWRGRFRSLVVLAASDGPVDDVADFRSASFETKSDCVYSAVDAGWRWIADQHELVAALETERPDVLVCCGHGEPGVWRMAGRPVRPEEIAASLSRARPRIAGVVLAMCHSSDAPSESGESMSEGLARRGPSFVIGFHGRPRGKDVAAFTEALLQSLSADGLAESRSGEVSLAAWESAVFSARERVQDGSFVATFTVNPERELAKGIGLPARAGLRKHDGQGTREFVAIPWFVPAQLLWGIHAKGGEPRPIRVPLPTDIGARLHVSLARNLPPETSVRVSWPGKHPDDETHLRQLISDLQARWPALRDCRIGVDLESPIRVVRWANDSAHVSAFARAASHALDEDLPLPVLDYLGNLVAAELGAVDAAPRAYAVEPAAAGFGETGYLRRYDAWPSLDVQAGASRAAVPIEGLLQPRLKRVLASELGIKECGLAALEAAITDSAALIELVRRQRPDCADLASAYRGLLSSPGYAILPAAVCVVPRTSGEPGPPRLIAPGVPRRRSNGDVLDELAI